MRLPRTALMMWGVAAATLPAIFASAYVYGAAALWQCAVLLAAAVAAELGCLRWRRKPLAAAADGSAVVAACVLAVALPPHAPWVVAVAAAVGAIALAKHCYGGLGNNPFNPAMVGYALAFFAYPTYFAEWDAASHPTPLAATRLGVEGVAVVDGAPLVAGAAAAGGLVLLLLRVADWRLTAGFLLGGAAVHAAAGGAWDALLYGGFVFAAFFVITDPVTAAHSRAGRWCYAIAVGALALVLRQHGAHSDGIAFAVLVGNMLAPLFDLLADKWRR